MRKAWEIATKRSGGKTATGGPWVSTKSSRLCHEHFRDDEINVIIGPDGNVARRELRENVVPTLKLPGKVDKSPRRTLVRHGVPAEEPLKLTGKNISSAEELRAYITRLDPLAKEKGNSYVVMRRVQDGLRLQWNVLCRKSLFTSQCSLNERQINVLVSAILGDGRVV